MKCWVKISIEPISRCQTRNCWGLTIYEFGKLLRRKEFNFIENINKFHDKVKFVIAEAALHLWKFLLVCRGNIKTAVCAAPPFARAARCRAGLDARTNLKLLIGFDIIYSILETNTDELLSNFLKGNINLYICFRTGTLKLFSTGTLKKFLNVQKYIYR